MKYEEALQFIHSLDKFGSRPGLDRIQKIIALMPDIVPLRVIHVAGTNGKGSVCVMLSRVLSQCGKKTGLFVSPYVTEFRERIQINNAPISQGTLTAAVEHCKPLLEKLNDDGVIITEFEFLTVLAFYIFKNEDCDIIVCETGMGGLLDSTNIIEHPLCSVITKIDYDHTAILGNTIEEITAQKCGIIKENGVTVCAAQDQTVKSIIQSVADEKRNILFDARDIMLHKAEMTRHGIYFEYQDEKMFLPLVGSHQADNLRCALSCIKALNLLRHMRISSENIRDGLARVTHPARFETLSEKPVVILDGAHNKNGLSAFCKAVRDYYGYTNKTLILGMLKDKDSEALYLLKGLFKRIITTDIDNPRALDSEELSKKCAGLSKNIEVIRTPSDAFDKAITYGDDIFICGSLYLAGEIRPYILKACGHSPKNPYI